MNILSTYQEKTLRTLLEQKGKPITGRSIAVKIGLNPRSTLLGADMRAVIHALRVKGYPVCAGGEGYYYPQTSEQLSKFIMEFQARVDDQQKAVDGLKNSFCNIGYQFPTPEEIEKKKKDEDDRLRKEKYQSLGL